MEKKVVSLNSDWKVTGRSLTTTTDIPVHVHNLFEREKKLPEMYYRDNVRKYDFIEKEEWTFSRSFEFSGAAKNLFLEFLGIDTFCDVILNGEKIAYVKNMFIPHKFRIDDKVKQGNNTIELKFYDFLSPIDGKDLNRSAAFAKGERTHTRRMQCTYGWDWVDRFVSAGIWKDVNLVSYGDAKIDNVFAFTYSVDSYGAEVTVEVETEKFDDALLYCESELYAPNGKLIDKRGRRGIEKFDFHINVKNPELWWPNGYGSQPLYSVKTTLMTLDGVVLDEKTATFGIRTVRILCEEDEPGSIQEEETKRVNKNPRSEVLDPNQKGISYNMLINGVKILLKGGNWVPADPFPETITKEKYDHLIFAAKEANYTILRVWGGGIYEREEFYDACDRYGIMIEQDFMMACADYPAEDPDFTVQYDEECPILIKELRNHPCIVVYAGDNENPMKVAFDDYTNHAMQIFDLITKKHLDILDRTRPNFPSSPYGGNKNLSLTVMDSHYSALTVEYMRNSDLKDIRDLHTTVGRCMYEYATCGVPVKSSLLKFMTQEDIDDKAEYMLDFHTKNNPYKPADHPTTHGGIVYNAEKYFGAFKDSDDQLNKMGQIQYEVNRLGIEGVKNKPWYSSGIVFWMYNDCWPASGLANIDYYGVPKAGYYGMKKAYQTVMASIIETKNSYDIIVSNELPKNAVGELIISSYSFKTEKLKKVAKVKINAKPWNSDIVYSIQKAELSEDLMFELLLTGDFESYRQTFFTNVPKFIPYTKGKLSVTQKPASDGKSGTVKIKSENFARIVSLEGEALFSDNYFDMFPGQEIEISWKSREPLKGIGVTSWK